MANLLTKETWLVPAKSNCGCIKSSLPMQSKRGLASHSLNAGLVALLRKSDKKLVAIPVLLVLLRMWGTVHFFYSLAAEKHINEHRCTTSRALADGFTFFGVMQVKPIWKCVLL